MASTTHWFSTYSIILVAASAYQLAVTSTAAAGQRAANQISKAVSTVNPTTGNKTSGSVVFKKTSRGVKITAKLSGMPKGAHGFHIHAVGDCNSGDGTSAGGHFNPHQVDHGGPNARIRHVGDLGNIIADTKGKARYERIDTRVALEGPNNIVGKGIIVHAGADDLTTQPTGAAGARIGCGVIVQQ